MKLVRLTINREAGTPLSQILVEHGDAFYRELTKDERKELKTLEKQLENFTDFSTAEKLQDDQRTGVMAKKKRYEELQQLPTTQQIEWKIAEPQPAGILLIHREDNMITYIEGMPGFLFDKLFSQDINITVTGGVSSSPPVQEPQGNRLYEELDRIKLSKPWKDLLDVEYKDGVWWISPQKWLDKDYPTVDNAMKDLKARWVSKGKGDRTAHWEVEL